MRRNGMQKLLDTLTTVIIYYCLTITFTTPDKTVVTTKDNNIVLCHCEEWVYMYQTIRELEGTPCGEQCKIKVVKGRGKDKFISVTYREYGYSNTSGIALPGYCDWETVITFQERKQLEEWERQITHNYCGILRRRIHITYYQFRKVTIWHHGHRRLPDNH